MDDGANSVALIFALLILASSIWVYMDARRLMADLNPVQRKQASGIARSPVGWFLGCLILWIIVFPCYLAARAKYIAASGSRTGSLPQARPIPGMDDRGGLASADTEAMIDDALAIQPGQFEVRGVDKKSAKDRRLLIRADNAANARVKAELAGIVVTSVRPFTPGASSPASPASSPRPQIRK